MMRFNNPIETVLRFLRRYYYIYFKPMYIKESLGKRKGKCNHCGCCQVMIPPCDHYDYATHTCRVWKSKGFKALPYICQIYPFDEKDKHPYAKDYCGYYWVVK